MISNNPLSEQPNANEVLLELLLTRTPFNFAIFDREMRYLLYTQSWADQLRIGDRSLVGCSHVEALPGTLECWVDGHRRALQGESFSSASDFYEDPESSKRWISWEIGPWNDAGGQIGGSILTFREITDRVNIESKLRCEMEAASAANLAKARLLVNTSYEVRSAMNSIVGMAHLCLRSDQDEKNRRHLRTIITEATDLTSSFEDIVDLSKVEAGSLRLECHEFDLGEVLEELATAIGTEAEEKGVEFVYRLPETSLPSMLGDPVRLKQILNKLCKRSVNLAKCGEVELGIEIVGPKTDRITLEFSVRDTSDAFTPQERAALMAPLTSGEGAAAGELAKTSPGLSVCKSLIGLMNGKIRVSSEVGRGNNFSFTAEFGVSPQGRAKNDVPPHSLAGARVLVVDDHVLARKTMSRLLRSFGFEVGTAETGAHAIEMAEEACHREYPYQFVFVDYLMPGMNGLETATKLKEKLSSRSLPKVILMTGRPMEDKMQEMENSLLDGYIAKPFTPSLIFYAMLDASRVWPASEAAGEAEPSKENLPVLLRGRRILLVEDDPINQEIVQEILSDAGLVIDVASNGKEGIDCLEDGDYDAVLMDLQMPVMDGYEATCRIRSEARFSDLPIIALTASAMTLDRHASLEVGMNAHIAKPVSPAELMSVLAEWIEPGSLAKGERDQAEVEDDGPPSPSSPSLKFKNFDAGKGLALMGGNEKLYWRILQKFAVNQAEADREIRAALSIDDHQAALRLAHTLKGLAGNVGASMLVDAAQKLEVTLKRRDSDQYETDLRGVSVELRRVVSEISDRIRRSSDGEAA